MKFKQRFSREALRCHFEVIAFSLKAGYFLFLKTQFFKLLKPHSFQIEIFESDSCYPMISSFVIIP